MAHLQSQAQYMKRYQEAEQIISNQDTKTGITLCEILLMENDLPRYYRIKTLILLAFKSRDWREQEELRVRAEHTWNESRMLWPEGQDHTTDATLMELRILLDKLKSEHIKQLPRGYEDQLSSALAETEIEDLADIADGELETIADHEYDRVRSIDHPVEPMDRESLAHSILQDTQPANVMPHQSGNGPSFAMASTLDVSQDLLREAGYNNKHSRDGQTAGSRMVRRKYGPTRRSL